MGESFPRRRRAEIPALNSKELLAFFSKIQKAGPTRNPCWEWTGSRNKDGYGTFGLRRKNRFAHVVAWTIEHGPIPDHLEIDHLCRNRACVRPQHMELVTHRENLLRGKTVTGLNAAKTHCKRGHPFDDENTIIVQGGRQCRACNQLRHPRKAVAA